MAPDPTMNAEFADAMRARVATMPVGSNAHEGFEEHFRATAVDPRECCGARVLRAAGGRHPEGRADRALRDGARLKPFWHNDLRYPHVTEHTSHGERMQGAARCREWSPPETGTIRILSGDANTPRAFADVDRLSLRRRPERRPDVPPSLRPAPLTSLCHAVPGQGLTRGRRPGWGAASAPPRPPPCRAAPRSPRPGPCRCGPR